MTLTLTLTQSVIDILPLEQVKTLTDDQLEYSVTSSLRLLAERFEEEGDHITSEACFRVLGDEESLYNLIDEVEEMAHS